MCIPISQGQSGSWDSSMAAMGFTIGEAPNIPTNIPPETKNGGEHQHQPKNEKKMWVSKPIICFQGTHNHRHIFHAASCKWVPPLRWLWPDVHPSWGSSWEVSPVQGNGAPDSEICGNWQVFQKHDLSGWIWIHVNLMNITWVSTVNSLTHGNRRLPPNVTLPPREIRRY